MRSACGLPVVTTVSPRHAPALLEVDLPGSMDAILETGIWARTDGYLKARFVDIGDRVAKGQQLADIETPEVDQQLMQTVATLNQDKANVAKAEADLALARTTLQRYVVAGVGTVSKQQIDERTSAVTDAAEGRRRGAGDRRRGRRQHAPPARAAELPEGVRALRRRHHGPQRRPGRADLCGLDHWDARALPPRTNRYAPHLRLRAAIVRPRHPLRAESRRHHPRAPWPRLRRNGDADRRRAIDPASRTMRAEVQVPNTDGTLLSGSYATVGFKIERPDPPLLVPQSALLVDASGVRVAVVDADGTLRYRPIQIGRDYGTDVEVLGGVGPDDMLATGIAANVTDGTRVETAAAGGAPHRARRQARRGCDAAPNADRDHAPAQRRRLYGRTELPSCRPRRRRRRTASSPRSRRPPDGATSSRTARRRRGGRASTIHSRLAGRARGAIEPDAGAGRSARPRGAGGAADHGRGVLAAGRRVG